MELKKTEQEKYETIEKVVKHEISKKEAENLLKLSRQHINRLIKIYAEQGKDGFIHKNRGKVCKNKKDPDIIKEIEELYLSEYFDYNFEAFYEEIEKKYDISYSVMCKAFLKDDIISPIAHKKTVKLYNDNMKNAISTISENNDLDKLLLLLSPKNIKSNPS